MAVENCEILNRAARSISRSQRAFRGLRHFQGTQHLQAEFPNTDDAVLVSGLSDDSGLAQGSAAMSQI